VAVVTGALEHGLNFRGYIHVGFQAARSDHGRIRPAGLNELNQDQKRNNADDDPACRDTFHGKISPKKLIPIFAILIQ
jgi:hypothetical protein